MVVESGRGTLVLIVEDEPDNREIMRAVVEELLGFRTVLANDGVEAIEMATNDQPSIILMDLMMPNLDGYEATRRIKANPLTSHIPVIAITALGRLTDRQRAMEEGADAYVSKPFDVDTLLAVIEGYASGRQ